MKCILLSFSFILLVIGTSIAQDWQMYDHDGVDRQYLLHNEDGVTDGATLIFVLHGYTSGAAAIKFYSGFDNAAEENGFVVCYPQGLPDVLWTTHWNAHLTLSSVDDIGFLSSLAQELQSEYNLNPDHTFVCGMSNGGFMSYTLACEAPDVFKAIASVTGTMSGETWDSCDPENVVPIMQISGSSDTLVPIDGSMTPWGGWGGAPHINEVVQYWVDQNECSLAENYSTNTSLSTEVWKYNNDDSGKQVWQYMVSGMGHTWPRVNLNAGIIATDEIVDFFTQIADGQSVDVEGVDLEQEATEIYPNPVSNSFLFESGSNQEYIIYNLIGNRVGQGELSVGLNSQDCNQLEQGIYFFTTLKSQQRIKFVKSN